MSTVSEIFAIVVSTDPYNASRNIGFSPNRSWKANSTFLTLDAAKEALRESSLNDYPSAIDIENENEYLEEVALRLAIAHYSQIGISPEEAFEAAKKRFLALARKQKSFFKGAGLYDFDSEEIILKKGGDSYRHDIWNVAIHAKSELSELYPENESYIETII